MKKLAYPKSIFLTGLFCFCVSLYAYIDTNKKNASLLQQQQAEIQTKEREKEKQDIRITKLHLHQLQSLGLNEKSLIEAINHLLKEKHLKNITPAISSPTAIPLKGAPILLEKTIKLEGQNLSIIRLQHFLKSLLNGKAGLVIIEKIHFKKTASQNANFFLQMKGYQLGDAA